MSPFANSDDENSDFSWFESDDLPLADLLADSSSSEDDQDANEAAEPTSEWTNRFTPPTIRIRSRLINKYFSIEYK
jgi:hypothetical protein